jgi:hypothetical protein
MVIFGEKYKKRNKKKGEMGTMEDRGTIKKKFKFKGKYRKCKRKKFKFKGKWMQKK